MKKMHLFLLLLFVPAILIIFVWLGRDYWTSQKLAPVYQLSDQSDYQDKPLLLRRVSPNGDLLLKKLGEETVIRYDVKAQKVFEVDLKIWHAATGKVSVSQPWLGNEPNFDEIFGTRGKYFLTANYSPSKTKLATFSAAGPKLPSVNLIPFMGGGERILGTRYLEIKDPSNKFQTIGEPFLLPDINPSQICWTDDENLVVVYDLFSFRFSVINLNQNATPTDETLPQPVETGKFKPDLARVTRFVRDYGVDENGDGLFEKIAVEVETEVSVAGKYVIGVSLIAENGISKVEFAEIELEEGLQTTKIVFGTETFRENKASGSFKVELFQLSYGLFVRLDEIRELGRTREYKLSELNRPNIVFTGENTVTPLDKNRNGKYEGLLIKIGVDVIHTGEYEFQGDLYDEFSTDTGQSLVEFGEGKATLGAGKGEIAFFSAAKKLSNTAFRENFDCGTFTFIDKANRVL